MPNSVAGCWQKKDPSVTSSVSLDHETGLFGRINLCTFSLGSLSCYDTTQSWDTAPANMDALTEQTRGMTLGSTAGNSEQSVATEDPLHGAFDPFLLSVEKTVSLARVLQTQEEDGLTSFATKLAAWKGASRSITAALEEIKEATAQSTVQQLVALGSKGWIIEALLESCYPILIKIAKRIHDSWTGRPELILARVAEACYMETASARGPLISSCWGKIDLLFLSHLGAKEMECWPAFWREVLSNCPHGPTLFDTLPIWSLLPFLDGFLQEDLGLPRYLFRVFDKNSGGGADDNEIKSQATVDQVDGIKTDLLSDDKNMATIKLYQHLEGTWWEYLDPLPDNLVSWTSSLLVALQYAVYRCHKNSTDPSDVKICVVDTSKFPRGQFVRDLQLIHLHNNENSYLSAQIFFNFRLGRKKYQNGEYISQGLVSIAGRSCVTSLGELEASGLYELYPEFEDSDSKKIWANRVAQLRTSWSDGSLTTEAEMQKARDIGRTCFSAQMRTLWSVDKITTEAEIQRVKDNERTCFSGQMSTAMTWMILCLKKRELSSKSEISCKSFSGKR